MESKNFDTYREKVYKLLDQLFTKPDITPTEIKNANDALCFLEKLNKIERGDDMRDQYGSDNYSGMPMTPYYSDNYGRRMRSSTTGRYMNGPNSGQTIYGHSIPDRMVAQLEDMMDQANNEYERQMIQNEIANIRKNSNMM